MYTVTMAHECPCFKKSEYESEKTFQFQKDAYNYTNTLVELMNEEFCTTHLFTPNITSESNFIISVVENPNAGSCSTGSCGPDDASSSCGTSCGC